MSYITHVELAICQAALGVLSRICISYDKEVVGLLTKKMPADTRTLDPETLGTVYGPPWPDSALSAAFRICFGVEQTSDGHWTVKRALLLSLASSATRGSQDALSLVRNCLEDRNADVCETAVEVFLSLTEP